MKFHESLPAENAGGIRVSEILTIAEVAELLRCSKTHVQNLLAGKIPGAAPLAFIPLGRRKLIRRESLTRWMGRAEGAGE